jgi:AraC-like DNA-binding protein
MTRQSPVIKSAVFDGIADFVTTYDLDLDVPALVAEVGLSPSVLDKRDQYVPLNAVSRFFERASILTRRPCFGLEYARVYPIGATGSLGYLIAHAPTFQDALENLVRFLPVMTHPMHVVFKEEGGGVGYIEWMFPLEFTAAMPQYVIFSLGAVIHRLRLLAGEDWTPLRVELIHRELPCPDIYKPVFGNRIRFEAAHNRMWVDPTTRAMRHLSADERLYRTAHLAGETELKSIETSIVMGAASLRARLRAHIQTVMATGDLNLETAATAMEVEPRQLQYALVQLRTSFSDEVSETRRMAAEQMLSATDMSMTDIAAALGFSELSSFTRACRELWFGLSPSKFRQRVKAEGIAPSGKESGDDWAERD